MTTETQPITMVAEYEANPSAGKQLGDGLSVQVRTKYEYPEEAAIEWATKNAPILLIQAVDRKAFEAMLSARVKARGAMLDFVTVKTNTIAVIKEEK